MIPHSTHLHSSFRRTTSASPGRSRTDTHPHLRPHDMVRLLGPVLWRLSTMSAFLCGVYHEITSAAHEPPAQSVESQQFVLCELRHDALISRWQVASYRTAEPRAFVCGHGQCRRSSSGSLCILAANGSSSSATERRRLAHQPVGSLPIQRGCLQRGVHSRRFWIGRSQGFNGLAGGAAFSPQRDVVKESQPIKRLRLRSRPEYDRPSVTIGEIRPAVVPRPRWPRGKL